MRCIFLEEVWKKNSSPSLANLEILFTCSCIFQPWSFAFYRLTKNTGMITTTGASAHPVPFQPLSFALSYYFPAKIRIDLFPVMIPDLFSELFTWSSHPSSKKIERQYQSFSHIWGALYGMVFLIAASNFFSSYPVLQNL
jgi:hypothetical protein